MATNTYVALSTQTLSSAVPTVTLNSFSGYTDLVLVISNLAISSGTSNIIFRLNGDAPGNTLYSHTTYGSRSNSTTPFASRTSNLSYGNINDYTASTTSQKTTAEVHFMNYSNNTTFKNIISDERVAIGDATYSGIEIIGNMWRNQNPITSIVISVFNGANFTVGSTFSLYGIAAEGTTPAAKATGGAIYSDADYYYHAFTSSGTFTPTQSISADCLVIGGGGGAGSGGGGAGGALAFASQSLTATGYTVTVGAGGAGGTGGSPSSNGTNGEDSQFGALTLVKGGGGGGGTEQTAGSNGGSGGGGGSSSISVRSGGIGSQGGNGGTTGSLGSPYAAGGGGGAGGNGSNGSGGIPGAGGVGISTITNWGSLTSLFSATGLGVSGTIAGGGGGGAYSTGNVGGSATGGGGAGSPAALGTNGLANTGGGGGGGNTTTQASGGSGIVIVRYAK